MPVEFNRDTGIINLHNEKISYIIQILGNRYPVHRYFGKYIPNYSNLDDLPKGNHAFAVDTTEDFPFSITSLPLEYSTIGDGDYHQPAYLIKDEQNHWLPTLKYCGLSITDKLPHGNLPQSIGDSSEVTTLVLHLADDVTKLQMDLNYTIFENLSLIIRSTTLHNLGKSALTIDALDSLQLNLSDDNFISFTLNGTHAHEANPMTSQIDSGIQLQHSFRGTSGPQHQPFIALSRPETSQFNGEVIGTALIWSGNFEDSIEVDQYQKTRLKIGLEPTTFSWQLKPQTDFQTPEAILTWSNHGYNEMSQIFHQFSTQTKLSKPSPIAINTWESMFFNVSDSKLSKLINKAASLDIEMVVLDDGWFTNRNSEQGQLGDWQVDSNKFPNGLLPLVERAHQRKLKFGLWIEPEMVTTNSNLFQEHPDWVLNYANRPLVTARHQLVLDLSREVVREHLLKTITNLVKSNQLDYLKWDMNRHLTQVGNTQLPATEQGEIYHHYVLGLYDLLNKLRQSCPNLIIENCSAGGGRLDFGMASYTNQTWLSDLTDSYDRTKIANGFSYLFPQAIFSNHVSAVPNGQNHRSTPLESRLQLASIGQMGFELDLEKLSVEQKDSIKKQIETYKNWRKLFLYGSFYRLTEINDLNIAWLITSSDKKTAIFFYSYGLTSSVRKIQNMPLHYLKDNINYSVNNRIYSGLQLNQIGLAISPSKQDFETSLIFITENSHPSN
ncbi:alpha-galactosidase [Companilactobacillus alimentarius]|uniref:Alpha-galactosidase n=1 Tax=Companilactobacillus alimentarius DSM 20249 TaxID=1423720 RepID=A0A2K9HH28_9LACO|nr:alpha-galactosidase [Companilactobacillus alimentarius]AUI71688.1 alpha-galactosidase [Companilactobacillus alimentarius DSM 20249]KRK78297.1 hypothetical protein FC67_GL000866 [Companilactobacillus alimentarius DSM 20249]GEO44569.1 alpha-galactosidase [Companilactobacillus alimentarius]